MEVLFRNLMKIGPRPTLGFETYKVSLWGLMESILGLCAPCFFSLANHIVRQTYSFSRYLLVFLLPYPIPTHPFHLLPIPCTWRMVFAVGCSLDHFSKFLSLLVGVFFLLSLVSNVTFFSPLSFRV